MYNLKGTRQTMFLYFYSIFIRKNEIINSLSFEIIKFQMYLIWKLDLTGFFLKWLQKYE